MSDVLTEVREAIKQERMEKFWNKYGNTIIALLILIVVSTAGHEGYKAWKSDHDKRQSALFLSTLDLDSLAAVQEKTAKIQPSLKALADLNIAGKLAAAGKTDDLKKAYRDILSDPKSPEAFRQLAQYALTRYDSTLTVDKKISILSEIWGNDKNPWRYNARLDGAVILANAQKNYKEARAQLAALIKPTDANIPKSIQQKALSLDVLYALKESAAAQDSKKQEHK